MKVQAKIIFIISLASLGLPETLCSFWDSLPIISQLKSLVQVIGGDVEGARRTQENFADTAPVVSQIKSAVHAGMGDQQAARDTQMKFAKNVEELVDSTPVVGHIKGGIHYAVGDKDRGDEIMKGASSSAASLAGGLVGGPAGAIAAGAAMDGVITAVDSAVHKEDRPFGTIDYIQNFDHKTSGEHVDQAFGIGTEFLFGKKTGGRGTKSHHIPDSVPPYVDIPHRVDTTIKEHVAPKKEVVFGSSLDDLMDTTSDHGYHSDSGSFSSMDVDSQISSGGRSAPTLATSEARGKSRLDNFIAERSGKSLDEVKVLSPDQRLSVLRDFVVHLEPEYRSKLTLVDFLDVNSFRGAFNCYLCTLAGASGKLISRIAKEHGHITGITKFENAINNGQVPWRSDTGAIGTTHLYRVTEFPGATFETFKDANSYHNSLRNCLKTRHPGDTYKFGAGYLYADSAYGHIVVGRAWLSPDGQLRTLYTDFQVDPFEKVADRFSTLPVSPNVAISDVTIIDFGPNEHNLDQVWTPLMRS